MEYIEIKQGETLRYRLNPTNIGTDSLSGVSVKGHVRNDSGGFVTQFVIIPEETSIVAELPPAITAGLSAPDVYFFDFQFTFSNQDVAYSETIGLKVEKSQTK